ncbi:MFS transporter [Mariniflexile sp.]|uniref:MFS transporter n=1 Tax=Mariniflexile sp. TaxID=1979402 RepID=UPI0035620940
MNHSKYILPVIIFSQFFCTSLWFAGNGIIQDLVQTFNLEPSAIGHLTSAVQLGFIMGTFLFALLTITDRFSPSKVFCISAVIAAVFNLGMILKNNNLLLLITFRFFTGFFLAGIYPVGMKIAADYYEKGLGKSLGYLVGALVVGTALPHLLNGFNGVFAWEMVVYITSGLAVFGGLIMFFFVPDGPYRKPADGLDFSIVYKVFSEKKFRAAAIGYFGHMWELYAFWAFTPLLLIGYQSVHSEMNFNISFLSFLIIASGGIACIISGYLSSFLGTKSTATMALTMSCICCLISPLIFQQNSEILFISFMVFWGMAVIADSPLFSTLIAQNSKVTFRGTALTIVNSIGFAVTIISIQLMGMLVDVIEVKFLFVFLAIGPMLGLINLFRK